MAWFWTLLKAIPTPTLPQIILVLRYLVTAGGAILIAHSQFVTASTVETALGYVTVFAPIVLGWITNLQQVAKIKEAALTGTPIQATLLSPVTASPAAVANAAATLPTK